LLTLGEWRQDPQREAGWLNRGLLAERRQDSPTALQAYMAALKANPSSSAAYVRLGSVMESGSKHDAAQAAYEKAISLNPEDTSAHKALGGLLLRLERPDAARQAAERAIKCVPDAASAHLALGAALNELSRPREAEKALRRAIELEPSGSAAHNNLGMALKAQGRYAEAEAAYKAAVDLAPGLLEPLFNLGIFYREQGALYHDAATATLNKALAIDPANMDVRLVLATMQGQGGGGGGGGGLQLPRRYVEKLFDSVAEMYEETIIEGISYQVPNELVTAVTKSMGADCGCASGQLPANQWAVLDLGCGTGLSGAALRGTAMVMAGCDISDKMCQVARRKGAYASVAHADAVAFLADQPPHAADLIIAGDLAPFMQDLRPLLAAAARVLKPGARFALTTEEDPRAKVAGSGAGGGGDAAGAEQDPEQQAVPPASAVPALNARARYCHAQELVEEWAAEVGLAVLVADSCTLHKQVAFACRSHAVMMPAASSCLLPRSHTVLLSMILTPNCTRKLGVLGDVLGMYWACIGYVLGVYWVCIGRVLGMYWVTYWVCIGRVLGMYWVTVLARGRRWIARLSRDASSCCRCRHDAAACLQPTPLAVFD
jgi:predicted TPR repeat methyltransferase